jgi:purine nucleosidase
MTLFQRFSSLFHGDCRGPYPLRRQSLEAVGLLVSIATWILLVPGSAQISPEGEAGTQTVILDTDIGGDVDDAYALTLLVTLRKANILGITTASGASEQRAQLAAKLLARLGRPDIPVYAGAQSEIPLSRQYEWARGFRSPSLMKVQAIDFLREQIRHAPKHITLIAIGPLTNIGNLFERYPWTAKQVKNIVMMGGAVELGYNGQAPPVPEYNIQSDPISARIVFESGAPITMAALDATAILQLDEERQKKLYALGTPATDALAALTNLWGNKHPTLFDPMAVSRALGYHFADELPQHLVVEDDGLTHVTDGRPNVSVMFNPRKDAFLDWYVTVHGSLK